METTDGTAACAVFCAGPLSSATSSLSRRDAVAKWRSCHGVRRPSSSAKSTSAVGGVGRIPSKCDAIAENRRHIVVRGGSTDQRTSTLISSRHRSIAGNEFIIVISYLTSSLHSRLAPSCACRRSMPQLTTQLSAQDSTPLPRSNNRK